MGVYGSIQPTAKEASIDTLNNFDGLLCKKGIFSVLNANRTNTEFDTPSINQPVWNKAD